MSTARKSLYAKPPGPRKGRDRVSAPGGDDRPPRTLFNVSIPGTPLDPMDPDAPSYTDRLREARAGPCTFPERTAIKIRTAAVAADAAMRPGAIARDPDVFRKADEIADDNGVYGLTGQIGYRALRELELLGRPPVHIGYEQPFCDAAFIDGLRTAFGKPPLSAAFLAYLVSRLPPVPTPAELRLLGDGGRRALTVEEARLLRLPAYRHDLIVRLVEDLPDNPRGLKPPPYDGELLPEQSDGDARVTNKKNVQDWRKEAFYKRRVAAVAHTYGVAVHPNEMMGLPPDEQDWEDDVVARGIRGHERAWKLYQHRERRSSKMKGEFVRFVAEGGPDGKSWPCDSDLLEKAAAAKFGISIDEVRHWMDMCVAFRLIVRDADQMTWEQLAL